MFTLLCCQTPKDYTVSDPQRPNSHRLLQAEEATRLEAIAIRLEANARNKKLLETRSLEPKGPKAFEFLEVHTPFSVLRFLLFDASRRMSIYGGETIKETAKRVETAPIDIICATPGRLIALLDETKYLGHVVFLMWELEVTSYFGRSKTFHRIDISTTTSPFELEIFTHILWDSRS